MLTRHTAAALGALALAAAAIGSARADVMNFDLTNLNTTGFPQPYVNVNVDLTSSTTATFTFTGLSTGGFNYYMIDGGAAGLNINAGTFSESTVTYTGVSGFQSPAFHSWTSGNEDGFGSFNLRLNDSGGWSRAAEVIMFTVTNGSGTWSSASDVLVANNDGFMAASHIGVCTVGACSPAIGATFTGFSSGNGSVTPEPEPGTLALFAAGLGGLGWMLRRRGRRS